MSNKSSFESKVLDFLTNGDFAKVEVVMGLAKEIYRRRKADHAESEKRVSQIAAAPAPTKVRRKRRTKKEIEEAKVRANGSDATVVPSTVVASA